MLTNCAEGVLLEVRAHPAAKRNEIKGCHNGALKVYVTQAPEKGKANKSIKELLAKSLKIKSSQIELVSGETSSSKKFLLRNIDAEYLKNFFT
ncbi:MAG: DUF167 domain-containing protein [Planctomycetaceae bacterium]|jgi:uncharacterized protein (TIGR00251 family)|nr:DUF167 domain-containing protein [Planctomycetaceae bacterium]